MSEPRAVWALWPSLPVLQAQCAGPLLVHCTERSGNLPQVTQATRSRVGNPRLPATWLSRPIEGLSLKDTGRFPSALGREKTTGRAQVGPTSTAPVSRTAAETGLCSKSSEGKKRKFSSYKWGGTTESCLEQKGHVASRTGPPAMRVQGGWGGMAQVREPLLAAQTQKDGKARRNSERSRAHGQLSTHHQKWGLQVRTAQS